MEGRYPLKPLLQLETASFGPAVSRNSREKWPLGGLFGAEGIFATMYPLLKSLLLSLVAGLHLFEHCIKTCSHWTKLRYVVS